MKLPGILLILLLCACGTPKQCPTPPVPRQWTASEQIQIVKAHNQLPPDSILRAVLDEWETTRRALR